MTTRVTRDGALAISEQHSVTPGSLTGLFDSEYSITPNVNFLPQADQVSIAGSVVPAHFNYDNDAILTCAGATPSPCDTSSGVAYRFDNGSADTQPSGHGLLEGTTSGSVVEAFGYNIFGELATHAVTIGATPLLTFTYDEPSAPRDGLGRIVTRRLTRGAQTAQVTYGYDEKGQLLTVEPDGEPLRTNVYDPNGNRLCTYPAPATDCENEAVYDAQDRLLFGDGVSYLYTDRGSLFQRDDGTKLETFTYDALGNLTRVERDNAPPIDYIIDAQGHRVSKHVGGILRKQYVWSSALRIVAEHDVAAGAVSRFIYGHKPNVPDLISRTDGSGTRLYRVITDHLGSPVYVVNIANPSDVLLDASYDEWGKVTAYTASTGVWPIPFGFAGGLYDEDTGLVRFGARDYDPRSGRWTSKDPIRWGGGQTNLYVYVGNDSINGRDSGGLSVQNNSDRPIFVIPEEGGRGRHLIPVLPGATYYGQQDGFFLADNVTIFKTNNGVDAIIQPDGSIETFSSDIKSSLAQWFGESGLAGLLPQSAGDRFGGEIARGFAKRNEFPWCAQCCFPGGAE